jgi:hypothetical protein
MGLGSLSLASDSSLSRVAQFDMEKIISDHQRQATMSDIYQAARREAQLREDANRRKDALAVQEAARQFNERLSMNRGSILLVS